MNELGALACLGGLVLFAFALMGLFASARSSQITRDEEGWE